MFRGNYTLIMGPCKEPCSTLGSFKGSIRDDGRKGEGVRSRGLGHIVEGSVCGSL